LKREENLKERRTRHLSSTCKIKKVVKEENHLNMSSLKGIPLPTPTLPLFHTKNKKGNWRLLGNMRI